MAKFGALPDWLISELIKNGFIRNAKATPSPASLDVHLGDECYRIKGAFLPKDNEEVFAVAKEIGMSLHDLRMPLTVGETYLIPLAESFSLPDPVYAYANPKSSTGRNDVHVRIVADRVARFDALTPGGYSGRVWAIVNPNSYPVLMPPGLAVSQLRFFNRDTRLSDLEMSIANTEANPFLLTQEGKYIAYRDMASNDRDGSLTLSADLTSGVIGYMARKTQEVFDFGAPNQSVDHQVFFEKIAVRNGILEVERDRFYILSTLECLRVPPEFSCEVVDLDSRSGDFRAHYAGFIDPGWGYGADGTDRGWRIVLEVRSNERRLCFRHGQPLSRFRFERMCDVPLQHYAMLGSSNYRGQSGPQLSKHYIAH